MSHRRPAALLSLAACLLALTAAAADPLSERGETALDRGEPRVEATLVTDQAVAVPGERVRVGVLFKMDPEWHVYWRNAGEAGLPSEVEVRVAGAEVGDLQYPFPETVRDTAGLITTYAYHGEVLLFREVRLPLSAGAEVPLEASVDV